MLSEAAIKELSVFIKNAYSSMKRHEQIKFYNNITRILLNHEPHRAVFKLFVEIIEKYSNKSDSIVKNISSLGHKDKKYLCEYILKNIASELKVKIYNVKSNLILKNIKKMDYFGYLPNALINNNKYIKQSGDNFFSEEITREDGSKLYFNLEKLNDGSREYWQTYSWNAARFARNTFIELVHSKKLGGQPVDTTDYFNYFEAKNLSFSKDYFNLKVENTYTLVPMFNLEGGVIGMDYVLLKKYYNPMKDDRYVAYITKDKIIEPISNNKSKMECLDSDSYYKSGYSIKDFQNYIDDFENIVMSVGVVTHPDSILTTHLGIFKNPLYFLTEKDKFKNLSMVLHGFAANYFESLNKKIMGNSPIDTMTDILKKNIPEEKIIIKKHTNDESKRKREILEHLTPGPSHINVVVKLSELSKFYKDKKQNNKNRPNL